MAKIAMSVDRQKITKESFCNLIERYQKPMLAYIYSKVRNHNATHDILQEMWLRAYKSLAEKDIELPQIAPWLYGIAKNCCHEWRRQEKRHEYRDENAMQAMPARQDQQSKDKIMHVVLEVIQDLPEEPRLVISMKYMHQMSCDEIARALNMPVGTVWSILSRSYETIRKVVSNKLKEVEL